jgi:hypothetical protein
MRWRTRGRLAWLAAGAIGAAALASAPAVPGPPGAQHRGGPLDPPPTGTAPSSVPQPQPPAGPCRARGAGLFSLPDPRCTPGALNPAVTQRNVGATICTEGFTARERPAESVSEAEKRASLTAYGDTGPLRDYEYDHLIPLELGGAVNDLRNLWPEPGASPNRKDTLERRLARFVCRGRIALAYAQRLIATDWTAAYRRYVSPGATR